MTKSKSYIPEGFHSVTPYLVVPGVTRLIDFLKEAFGAEELFRAARQDGSISHAEVKIGDSKVEMGEAAGEWHPLPAGLHLYVKDAGATYARAIQAGGVALYEPRNMEYGDHEGGVTDPSGNHWYIATHRLGKNFVPEGFRSVTAGFCVKGAADFLAFLVKAFGAEIVYRHEGANGTVGHAQLRVGDTVIECSDALGQ
jgi:PhnB protein